ncbi:MAG: aspartate aminotransferase family protein [Candidatus Dormibacteria bacterium]
MLNTAPRTSTVAETIRTLGGGGPRRIAESAGLVITHGEGSHLVDETGRRYLDFATAMGVAAIGHANPIWVHAVQEQAARLAACVLHMPEQAEYLEALAGVLPEGLQRTALYSGGTEAVEVAVRLAQSVTGNREVISFTAGFHGKTTGVRFTGDRFPDERVALGVDWIHHVPYPVCTEHDAVTYDRCEEDGARSLTALGEYAATLTREVAAVIVEPVLGTAGNRPPQRRFLQGLRRLCNERGWLMILDESITGFGRLGTNFAAEYFDVQPDILVLGKAMGGGFPLSGVASSSAVWDASLYAEMSATSSSYGFNPLACAAGAAVVEVLRSDGFLANVRSVGAQLARGITEIAAASPYVRNPRGVGMMLGFDFVDPKTGRLAGPDLCGELFRRCLEQGLLIVGDVPGVRLNPTLVLTPDEARRALEGLAAAVCH